MSVNGAEPIWIAADAADAQRLLAQRERSALVLGLTPAARAVFAEFARDQIDPRRTFTDWAQARTVVAVRRARQRLVGAVASSPRARAIEREIALDHFLRVAYTGYRLWFTLGSTGPWMVPQGDAWLRCDTREVAYRAVLRHMMPPHVASQADVVRACLPPLRGVYRLCRNLLLHAACRNRVVLVSGARKGMFGLLEAVAADSGPARIVVVQSSGGWQDYLRLVRVAWRMLRGGRFLEVSLLAQPSGNAAPMADRLIAAVGDPVITAALGFYRDLLAYRLSQVASAVADAGDIVSAASPRHYVSPEISRLSDWALAEACGEARVARSVLSRNTHVPACSRLAEDACQEYFGARHPDGLVDRYLFWTPHGAAAARAMLPRQRHSAIELIAAVPVEPASTFTAARRVDRPRQILLADTFAAFWFPHNWVFQTSDEYLWALDQVVAAVDGVSNARLLVRAKRKNELDMAAYGQLVRTSNRVSIKMRDVPFRQDLIESDLLVASRSTAIEEALHARVPVLLWGGSARYRYLPARTAPPTPSDRGTIYAASSPADLAAILPLILEAHAGRPLTDDEIMPHVVPASAQSVAQFARRLVEDREVGVSSSCAVLPSGL